MKIASAGYLRYVLKTRTEIPGAKDSVYASEDKQESKVPGNLLLMTIIF